jgi:hypothetical protein
MILSQTPIEEIDAILTRMYGGEPPRVLHATLTMEAQEDRYDEPSAAPPPPPEPAPEALLLHQLPTDALRELFAHVPLPFVLKLTCRALRDAWPERTELTLSHVCASSWRYRWATRVGCPWVWGAPLAAKMARHGCTNALLWAVMNGMSWDRETARQAAHHGHLDTLSRALAAGCEMDGTEVARKAASHGHLDILEWIIPKYSVKWSKTHTTAAARGGHLEVLKWLRARGIPWDSNAVTQAAAYNHAEVVEWAVRNGGRLRPNAMYAAAERGHLEMVTLLRERLGCAMTEQTCGWAAYGGRLEVLQYLRSGPFPCPWDEFTCEGAAMNGHLRVLIWAIEQGCPSTSSMWFQAGRNGRVHVLRWLQASGWPLVDNNNVWDVDPQVDVENKRTAAWLKRMRSPWQRVRNVVVARSVARYWSKGRCAF